MNVGSSIINGPGGERETNMDVQGQTHEHLDI